MYIKTRVFSFKFVNKYYSTLDPLQCTGTLLVVAKMPKLTSQPLDVDLMVRNDRWRTHNHHQLSLL